MILFMIINLLRILIIKITIPKLILKCVGGKTQILDKLIVEFPTNINNYREIF